MKIINKITNKIGADKNKIFCHWQNIITNPKIAQVDKKEEILSDKILYDL